jgi:hypothetical protein
MPRQEDIRNTIWQDIDAEELSNDAILLFIWSWTNERCGMSGLYRCPKPLLCEGRLAGEALDAALQQCEEAGRLRYEKGVLWQVTRVKRLPWRTKQTATAIAAELAEIDQGNPIYGEFVARYNGMPWSKDGEGRLILTQGSADPQPTLDPDSTEDQATLGKSGVEPSSQGSAEGHPRVQGKGNGNGNGSGKGRSTQGSTALVGLAADAPPAIRDAAPHVVEALGRISEIRGFPFADEKRVVGAMCTYPDADHVAVASDMEDWLCNSDHGKRREIKDLVQTYRGQLQRKQSESNGGAPASAEDFAEYDQAVVPSG